jgi:hypothetical protein
MSLAIAAERRLSAGRSVPFMTCGVIDRPRRHADHGDTPMQRPASGAGRRGDQEPLMSSNLVRPDSFLRRVLLADAAVSALVGLLMAAAAAALQDLLALPSGLLAGAGVALLPYAACLAWIATRAVVPRVAVWLPIVLNLLWAIDCLYVGFGGGYAPNVFGQAFAVVQVLTVLAFAELEFMGLRRSAALAA